MSDTVNIAETLARMAGRYPDKPAVIWPTGRVGYAHLTFRQLEREAECYAHGLERIGITRGTRTIFMVRPGAEFFTLTFALFKVGAVPIFIDPGMGARNVVSCLAELCAEAFIGIPLAHVLRRLHSRAFQSVRINVTVGRRWFWGGWRHSDLRGESYCPYEMVPTRADEQAAILFTSGSTGPAKGVVYEHGMFAAQVRYLQSEYGYGPEEIDLPTFPLFALFDVALGMTAVIPDMDFSRPGSVVPSRIVRAICDHGCTHMFGSPALLDRVARYGVTRGEQLVTLKRVITAGAPISPALLERLARWLPAEAEVFTPYGATEALPVASIGSREILSETKEHTAVGGGTCVGRPLDGIDVRVIEISDEPIGCWAEVCELPAGRIGEIVVKGSVVTKEYAEKPQATELAKIRDGERVWHRMGDVGYLDECGRLWFCGRKAQRVRTERGTLFTVPCEAIFNQHARVRRSALVGVGIPGRQRPVMCIELEEGTPDDALTRELLELAAGSELTGDITTVLYHPAFPVDVRHNAKISREKLALWAAERV